MGGRPVGQVDGGVRVNFHGWRSVRTGDGHLNPATPGDGTRKHAPLLNSSIALAKFPSLKNLFPANLNESASAGVPLEV